MPNYKANVTLTVYDGQDAFRTRSLTLYSGVKALIGRSATERGNNIRPPPARGNAFFDSPVVSRQHAHLFLGADSTMSIVDVGSLHGTFVNSHKLKPWEQKRLRDGDDIEIGGKVTSGDRIYSARKFKINYHVEPYSLHFEPPEPSQVPSKPVEPTEPAVAAAATGSTIPSPCQSTTFVVPDSSSDDSHDCSSCHESLELDEDDIQIIDELSSSPVGKDKPNNATQTDPASNKAHHRQGSPQEHNQTMQPINFINLTEDEEIAVGDAAEIVAHIVDLEGQEEDDSDLDDDDYHPIDDSSNKESEDEYDPESVPVRQVLSARVPGTSATSDQDTEWPFMGEAFLPEQEEEEDIYNPPATSFHHTDMSPYDSNLSQDALCKAASDQPTSTLGATDLSIQSSPRGPTASVPVAQPEYHSYYPISGISKDPYSRAAEPNIQANHRFESFLLPNSSFTSSQLGPTFIFGSSNGKGENAVTSDAATALRQFLDSSSAIKANSKDNLPGPNTAEGIEHKSNTRKRKADEISTDDPSPGHTATCKEAPDVQKPASQPLPLPSNLLQSIEKKTGAADNFSSTIISTEANPVKQISTPTSSSISHPSVAPEPKSGSAATLANKGTPTEPADDERPAKRCRIQESWVPSQPRPRIKPKNKSSLTTFALGAVLGGVVGGMSVMGALISLPDSLF